MKLWLFYRRYRRLGYGPVLAYQLARWSMA